MTATALKSCARLRDWYVHDTLPLWLERGYDHARGGFFETLDYDAKPIAHQPRRVRVQARQIYTFTEAALKGWIPEGEKLAAEAFGFYIDKACPDEGARGCVHLLSDSGEILDNRSDLYDQAFLLLACSARIKAGDDRAQSLANKTIEFLNNELASPQGGWRESDAGELPRRQNPHMHLFEAFMALYEATDDSAYRDLADTIHSLFLQRFFDAERGVLLEFFNDNLTVAPPPRGDDIEPGHMMEWVWLLNRHAQGGEENDARIMKSLFTRALELGADKQGFLADKISLGGERRNGTRRVWPQTEFIKAALVMAQQGDKNAGDHAAHVVDKLFDTYLDQSVAGLWCDQYDADGAALAKDVPASILYHWHEAVVQAAAYMKSRGTI